MSSKAKILFFGTPSFAASGLAALLEDHRFEIALVVTQPDKPAGRGGKVKASPVKVLAESHSIPVFQPARLKRELSQSIEEINCYGPFDIGVVIAYGQILPKAILDLPNKGCVNVHASLLPRWRGAAPIQRAMMNNDPVTGICLMQMDEGLDTGPVYSRSEVRISPDDNFETLHDKLAAEGAGLLKTDLLRILSGELKSTPQPEAGVTYADKITPAECRIDWNRSAGEIFNLIRALSPFPGAFTLWQEKRLKILKAAPKESVSRDSVPGQVSFADKSRLEVACREGVISIEELQLEGKKRMSLLEFLNGFRIEQGVKFE